MIQKTDAIRQIDINDNQIIIYFTLQWYQEDIKKLSGLILSHLEESEIKEAILGADRETKRFTWKTADFLLNFDYYSQSCWINSNDELSNHQIESLYKLLKSKLK